MPRRRSSAGRRRAYEERGDAIVSHAAKPARSGRSDLRQACPNRAQYAPSGEPSAAPTASPATTSDAWWIRTYARGRGDDAGQRPPQRGRSPAVPAGEHGGGERRPSWRDRTGTTTSSACGRRSVRRRSRSVGSRVNSRLMPWLTTRLSAPMSAASTGTWRAVRTLGAPRARLATCQMRLNSPRVLAVVNTAVGDRVASERSS